ncbi:MAG: TonB-dependent receptor plug domain-containing protein [Flavitalea sp.]
MRFSLLILFIFSFIGASAQSLEDTANLQQVVVTGTMRTVLKSASPVPVEVYTPRFFMKNPTPALFDALSMINGVRPQLNCNVCNTGDIHINGMEGPYTMILIDGMPIVSSLASVYGLFGIPNSLVDRIEVVKGPASSLYGSEAIGGLINVITKNPLNAPRFFADISSNSWLENNIDLGMSYKLSRKSNALLGVNYFHYDDPRDINNDNFTDVTLQKRFSIFNKISFDRKHQRTASLAFRYIHENRWGGEMQWKQEFRGTDSVYGEQINTDRVELIGNYQLPVKQPLNFSYSFNTHRQRSAYGTTIFNADQHIAFGQLTWSHSFKEHELLMGVVGRYTFYDDNSPATADTSGKINIPDKIFLPGIFAQQEFKLNSKQQLLLGIRYDYDKRHRHIITPRVAYKVAFPNNDVLRINMGTGFRVVNLFTEDHAALTGARQVVIKEKLQPEKSINANINYVKKIQFSRAWMNIDLSTWYTYFSNRILPDYTTDPNKIIYDNLRGHSLSYGSSLNLEMALMNSLRFHTGLTVMDVRNIEDGKSTRQILSERWSGNWAISYTIPKIKLNIDYTGNIYGSMLLPLVSDTDPRSPQSPVWSIQNIQLSKKLKGGVEVYAGIKNLLNWTPAKAGSFIIARSHDPFDKQVVFDPNGRAVATPENPYALTFDPNYVYAPNQGMKVFAGMRWQLSGK